MRNKEIEQTLVLIKPDALKNSLTGHVLSQLSEFHTGLLYAGAKIINVTDMLAKEHYSEHNGKSFFPSLIKYITGITHYPNEPWKRRILALVYYGTDAIRKIREIAGPTDPHEARDIKPGSIRSLGTFAAIKDASGNLIGDKIDNLIHASANQTDAEREIKLWFKPSDIPPLMRIFPTIVNKQHFYYKNKELYTTYEPGSICIVAPSDIVWASDIEALNHHYLKNYSPVSIESIVAKYRINMEEI